MTTTEKDKGVTFYQTKIDLEMAIHLISYDTKYIRNSLNSKKHEENRQNTYIFLNKNIKIAKTILTQNHNEI